MYGICILCICIFIFTYLIIYINIAYILFYILMYLFILLWGFWGKMWPGCWLIDWWSINDRSIKTQIQSIDQTNKWLIDWLIDRLIEFVFWAYRPQRKRVRAMWCLIDFSFCSLRGFERQTFSLSKKGGSLSRT